jgi:hypothetical protein
MVFSNIKIFNKLVEDGVIEEKVLLRELISQMGYFFKLDTPLDPEILDFLVGRIKEVPDVTRTYNIDSTETLSRHLFYRSCLRKSSDQNNVDQVIIDLIKTLNAINSADDRIKFIKLLKSCIKSFIHNENILPVTKDTSDEVMNFLECLTTEQFKKFKYFIDNLPTNYIPIKFNCNSCGKENNEKLEGLANFFI